MWQPMARTCGRPWHESTFQNMVHEQFAPVDKSQQLFKNSWDFLGTNSLMSFLQKGRQFCWKHCSSFSPQVRQRKFFNRLVNSPPNSSFLTTLLLMRPMWPRSWPCDKSIRKFFFSICIELLVFPEVRECSPAPQKNAHFFCIWQSLSMDPKVRRSTPNSSM